MSVFLSNRNINSLLMGESENVQAFLGGGDSNNQNAPHRNQRFRFPHKGGDISPLNSDNYGEQYGL